MTIITLAGYVTSIVLAAIFLGYLRSVVLGPNYQRDREWDRQNDPNNVSPAWLARFRR